VEDVVEDAVVGRAVEKAVAPTAESVVVGIVEGAVVAVGLTMSTLLTSRLSLPWDRSGQVPLLHRDCLLEP